MIHANAGHAEPPRDQDLEAVRRCTGTDVARYRGAMGIGHIKREMGLLLLAKYALDETVIPELRKRARNHVAQWRPDRGWKSAQLSKRVGGLADIALAECIHANRCATYMGVGSLMVFNRLKACSRCEGAGLVYPSGKSGRTASGRDRVDVSENLGGSTGEGGALACRRALSKFLPNPSTERHSLRPSGDPIRRALYQRRTNW